MGAFKERHRLELGHSWLPLRGVTERPKICLRWDPWNGGLLHKILPEEVSTATTDAPRPARLTPSAPIASYSETNRTQHTALVETKGAVNLFDPSPLLV